MRVSTSPANLDGVVFDSIEVVPDRPNASDLERIVQQRLGDRLAGLAQDPERFHQLLGTAFGEGYAAAAGEALRQRALAGDTSWMPSVRLVDAVTLGGANGAYDANAGTVLLNRALDPDVLAETYVEEAGHHLDTLVNRSDARGDEGELFRRLLGGELLSIDQVEDVRAENDHGRISIDGLEVQVEFWNPISAAVGIGKAVVGGVVDVGKAAVGAVVDAGQAAAGAVVDAGKAVGGAVVDGLADVGRTVANAPAVVWNTAVTVATDIGEGVWDGIKQAGVGSWSAAKDFGTSLIKGDIGGAFDAAVRFGDNLLIQAPRRVITGAVNAGGDAVMGAVGLIPFKPLREPLRELTGRAVSVAKDLTNKAIDIPLGFVRQYEEAATTAVNGVNKLLRGDWKGGLRDLGAAAWKATPVQPSIDAGIFILQGAVSGVQTLAGIEKPGRKLSGDEISELRKIFGDSVDYDAVVVKEGGAGLFSKNDGNRAFTVGNTIYLKEAADDPTTALNEKTAVLVSEMTHVWQFQHGGGDYAGEALWGQWFGRNYRIDEIPGKRWEDLEPEQQDAFLTFAYEQGAFNTDPPMLVADINGDGMKDNLTDYLRRTLEAIRAGRGAP